MKPVKVLHLITGLEGGGAERMLLRLVAPLRRRELESRVVSLTTPGLLADDFAALGIPVETLGIKRGSMDPRAILRLVRILRRERPDVLQTWLYHSDLVGTIAHLVDLRRSALLWNVRCGVFPPTSRTLAAVRRALVALSPVPATIVCNSNLAREEHVALGYAPGSWQVIPNSVDTARFAPRPEARDEFRRALGIGAEKLVVGIVGRADPLKDYPNFLDAAALVLADDPRVMFVMAGNGLSDANREFAAEIDRRGLGRSVVLAGESAEVSRVYPAFDVFCLSSSSESFPNVLAEAMACAVPCVTTNVGAAAGIVGKEGRVVPARDARALASALMEILTMKETERRELGLRGRERIEIDYSLDAITGRYAELYENAARRRG